MLAYIYTTINSKKREALSRLPPALPQHFWDSPGARGFSVRALLPAVHRALSYSRYILIPYLLPKKKEPTPSCARVLLSVEDLLVVVLDRNLGEDRVHGLPRNIEYEVRDQCRGPEDHKRFEHRLTSFLFDCG